MIHAREKCASAPSMEVATIGRAIRQQKSSVDLALTDACTKMRHFLMTTTGLREDDAISMISVAGDFGVIQVVDGNWGLHAIITKSLFAAAV